MEKPKTLENSSKNGFKEIPRWFLVQSQSKNRHHIRHGFHVVKKRFHGISRDKKNVKIGPFYRSGIRSISLLSAKVLAKYSVNLICVYRYKIWHLSQKFWNFLPFSQKIINSVLKRHLFIHIILVKASYMESSKYFWWISKGNIVLLNNKIFCNVMLKREIFDFTNFLSDSDRVDILIENYVEMGFERVGRTRNHFQRF